MITETTRASLLSRVRDPANHMAWREFDAKYGELIHCYCRALRLRYTDADEIRQIVMIRLTRVLRRLDYSPARGRFRSLLGRIVRNEVSRYFARCDRASRPVGAPGLAAQWPYSRAALEDAWEKEWMHHHLRLAMERAREAFGPGSIDLFERLLRGQPVEQIATDLGKTKEAVHKIKHRIRNRIREFVAEQILEEETRVN